VTVHDPISSEDGDIVAALYGSFLPIPSNDLFSVQDPLLYSSERLPGAVIARKDAIVINKGRERIRLRVTNTGDRPVQVRIHQYIAAVFLISCRLVHITISSKRMPPSLSTATARTGNALTFQQVPLSDSSQVTPRLSPSAQSGALKPFLAVICLHLVLLRSLHGTRSLQISCNVDSYQSRSQVHKKCVRTLLLAARRT
jgi:Urease beta subunit